MVEERLMSRTSPWREQVSDLYSEKSQNNAVVHRQMKQVSNRNRKICISIFLKLQQNFGKEYIYLLHKHQPVLFPPRYLYHYIQKESFSCSV